jgi:DNA-binding response OmpR family regulator
MARILLADDDPFIGDIVRATLSNRGYVVGVVTSGEDALRVAETKRPDLLILDCAMPGIGGVEALRRIRNSTIAFDTPVLMLTARTGRRDEEIGLRAGANDYLGKPFDPTELIVVVDRLLSKSAEWRVRA